MTILETEEINLGSIGGGTSSLPSIQSVAQDTWPVGTINTKLTSYQSQVDTGPESVPVGTLKTGSPLSSSPLTGPEGLPVGTLNVGAPASSVPLTGPEGLPVGTLTAKFASDIPADSGPEGLPVGSIGSQLGGVDSDLFDYESLLVGEIATYNPSTGEYVYEETDDEDEEVEDLANGYVDAAASVSVGPTVAELFSVLDSLADCKTVAELITACGLDESKVGECLTILQQRGMISVSGSAICSMSAVAALRSQFAAVCKVCNP